jgi:predicted polyphosphate/ATP-dependent NAD kinase
LRRLLGLAPRSARVRLAFVVNPVAGLGGRVGLKGTDGVADEALRRGAQPAAPARAARMLTRLWARIDAGGLPEPDFLTAAGSMGEDVLRAAGFTRILPLHVPGAATSADDTRAAVRSARALGAQLVVFVGGDGTARDVAEAAEGRVPITGCPAGVKMHSAVFALDPEGSGDIVADFLEGMASEVEAELLDVDEEAYRRGVWRVKLFAAARTLDEPLYRQLGKGTMEEVSDEEQKRDIAEDLRDRMQRAPHALWLLGPGSTLEAVARLAGRPKSLLGFDALVGGQLAGRDLGEAGILRLLAQHAEAWLVLSPIGAQGFVLGRGNQQASPDVVRRVGLERLLIVATPQKLRSTPLLHVDTGDPVLDAELRARGHLPVLLGWRTSRLVPVA